MSLIPAWINPSTQPLSENHTNIIDTLVKHLTYLLNMSKQAAAELITKLQKNGYLNREPSEDDKRVMIIKLTEEGKKAANNEDDNTPENLIAFDCLSDDELATFSDYLRRIIMRYEDQFPDEDFSKRRRYMEKFMSVHDHHHWHHDGHGFGHNFRHDFRSDHKCSRKKHLPPQEGR